MASHSKTFSRRHFVGSLLTAGIALQIPQQALSMFTQPATATKIGLITDLHQDVIHNGQERLDAFLTHMKKIKPNALLQIGDFAYPGDKNKTVIDMFNNAHSLGMHVIGNHDTDAGYTKQQCIDYWGMPARYYTKEVNDICFIILDGNDKGSPSHKGGYAAYINKVQKEWLVKQLKEINKPIVIVSHQPLAGGMAIDNAADIQDILATASDKILLAINGHTHVDCHVTIKNVNYIHINSASYFWIGSNYKHNSYTEDIHKEYPWISSTCPYKEPLFATLIIEPIRGTIKIEGRKTQWVGASPDQLNLDDKSSFLPGKEIVPWISNTKIEKSLEENKPG